MLDAGALIHLATLQEPLRRHGGRIVITPHAGEMAALLGISRDAVVAEPLGAARQAVALLQVVVVLKGGQTHVITPQGGAWTYAAGRIGLATSGSGDTLAGVIVGLLARGAPPLQAALWGVLLHGEAGNRLAKKLGRWAFSPASFWPKFPAFCATSRPTQSNAWSLNDDASTLARWLVRSIRTRSRRPGGSGGWRSEG